MPVWSRLSTKETNEDTLQEEGQQLGIGGTRKIRPCKSWLAKQLDKQQLRREMTPSGWIYRLRQTFHEQIHQVLRFLTSFCSLRILERSLPQVIAVLQLCSVPVSEEIETSRRRDFGQVMSNLGEDGCEK